MERREVRRNGLSRSTPRLLSALFVVFLALLAGPSVRAQERVGQVLVEGNQRIEAGTIGSYMTIAPGDPFDSERVDASLKALFATGLFADVTIARQGTDLIVRVVENPIVNRIAFEGNSKMKDDALEKEIQLKPRQVYTRAKVQSDVQRLLQMYRRTGRFTATVEPKVIQLPQNRIDVVFEIIEGLPTRIERIRFIGNERFSDGRLREEISTKETAWWRLWSSDDSYDPDRMNYDRELLRRFYLSHGYADFRLVSSSADLSPDREAFFITYAVEEGEQYKVAKIDISNGIADVEAKLLRDKVTFAEGDTYNAEKVEKSIQEISFELGRYGYAFIDVKPEIKKNREARTIDITFTVGEGPRVYVERINVQGNVRTLDRVIRREFRLAEGDAFNTARIRQSRQRLRALNFFETVDIKENRGSTPDRVVIDVTVQEKSTGELTLGAGFSTTDSILGDIALRERNFLGKGQDLRVGLTLSARRQQIDHSFTEPAFLDRDLAAGYDIFHRRVDYQDQSGYDQQSTGGGLRFGFPITESLRATTYNRVRNDVIDNVAPGASTAVQRQAGGTVTSSVGYVLAYDKRDDPIEPTSGYVIRGGNEFAGLGGTEHFVKTTASYTHFFAVTDSVVFSQGFDVGHVQGIADDVRIVSRFSVGGDLFRGFKQGGVGARDAASGDVLGAQVYYTSTSELEFPIGLPNEFGMKGRAFGIVGSASEVDEPGPGILDASSLRASVGVGLSWKSPFGPLRLDFAVPVVKEDFDQTEYFRFNFGTRF